MDLEKALEKIKELENKVLDLKNEAADRRIKNKELEGQVKELTSQVETLEKEKSDLSNKHGDSSELLKSKEFKIKELTDKLKEHETLINTYKENEQKEIESLREKLPENIREKFVTINDKTILSELVQVYASKNPNSMLSEVDNIINKAKTDFKSLTLEEKAAWQKANPQSYNEHLINMTKLKV